MRNRNWIVSLPRADMEHCIKIGTFGMKRKYLLGMVQKGDRVACYVTKEAKIIALGRVEKEYYCGKSSVFLSEGSFPHRIDFKASMLGEPIDFRSLLDHLKLIVNPMYWGAHLQLGITEICDADWNLLESKSVQLAETLNT